MATALPDLTAMLEIGLEHQQQGRVSEASLVYNAVLERDPGNIDAIHYLGLLAYQIGNFKKAIELLSHVIARRSIEPAAYNSLGLALLAEQRFEEALTNYHRALSLKPDFAEALYNRANVLQVLKRFEDSVASYDAAIALRPGQAEAHHYRGEALLALGRAEEAVASFDTALRLHPGMPEALNARGNALTALGRQADALASYDAALAQQRGYAEAHANRGGVLNALGRANEALASLDQALALDPQSVVAMFNRGNALKQLGRIDEAVADYRRALALQPDFAIAHHNLAICLLLLGDWEEGFREYEWRKACPEFDRDEDFAEPAWTGAESLAGKTLLIHHELFLGDMIQFSRYARLAAQQGAQVKLAAPRPLQRLLGALGAGVEVIGRDADPGPYDCHCALMSLPLAFGARPDDVPADIPYLAAEADRVQAWRSRLGEHGFKIGVCWQGSTLAYANAMQRSFRLRDLQGLARLPGVRLISLQKQDGLDQLGDLPEGMTVETLGDEFDAGPDGFLDTAAVMRCCDLVLTADTAVAHLAGALGVRTWIPLPHVPDWRWLLGREDSPWYPTVRLFRQTSQGDWAGVWTRIEAALADLIREGNLGGRNA